MPLAYICDNLYAKSKQPNEINTTESAVLSSNIFYAYTI